MRGRGPSWWGGDGAPLSWGDAFATQASFLVMSWGDGDGEGDDDGRERGVLARR